MSNAARVQRRLGLQDAGGMNLLQRARLAAALITQDEAMLRDTLLELRLLDNRFDTARAAWLIGRFARHADAAWWKRVIQAWVEVMPSAVQDFHIAWTAQRDGAVERARTMAALAARRSPEDEAQQQEARFFAAFVAQGGDPKALLAGKVERATGR